MLLVAQASMLGSFFLLSFKKKDAVGHNLAFLSLLVPQDSSAFVTKLEVEHKLA